MSYKLGTAVGFRDYVRQLRNFVCGYGEDSNLTYSGAQNSARLHWFGAKPQATPPAAGVTVETWTFVCTIGGNEPAAKFSVTGSTSGAQVELTAGVYYDITLISACIKIDSSQNFSPGDTFTIDVTGDSASYTADEYWQLMYDGVPSDGSGDLAYLQVQGKGLSADKTINILMRTQTDPAASEFNIDYRYAAGYEPDVIYDPEMQPGVSASDKRTYQMSAGRANDFALDIAMPFHIFMNAQRFICLNESTVGKWHSAYLGFFFPYGSPGQYPFPCYIAANAQQILTFASSSGRLGCFVDPGYDAGHVARPGGTGETVQHRNSNNDWTTTSNGIWPYGCEDSYDYWQVMRPGEFETHPMFAVVIKEESPGQMLGELDGVCAVPINSGAIDPGTTINDGVNDWVVFRHPVFTNYYNHFAIRKE